MSSSPGLAVAATGSFPSPAQDYYEGRLDLDRHLVRNPAATFVLRVQGNGLRSAGVLDGDELIVDRSLTLRPGLMVVVVLDGEHRVGRLIISDNRPALATDEQVTALPSGTVSWGVVTAAIHHLIDDGAGSGPGGHH